MKNLNLYIKESLLDDEDILMKDAQTQTEISTVKTDFKIGEYVAVRTKSSFSGAWGSSRGELIVDKVIKITPARIRFEKCGLRSIIDCVKMIDVNKNKDWNYKDPNGLNDITGVGIQVGDKVASYLASGHFGTNNGVEFDEVVGLTNKKIRCKLAGLRYPNDICILRSQEICKKQKLENI